MRRGAWAASLFVSGFSLVACAALSGLDQIREDPCAPAGCEDAATGDAAFAAEDADAAWTTEESRGHAPDAGATADSSSAGEEDVLAIDSSVGGEDARSDSSLDGDDEPPIDVGARDGQPEAQEAQAPDGPVDCGTVDDPDHCGACEIRCGTCAGTRSCTDGTCGGGTVYYYEPFTGGAPGWTLDPTWSAAPECANPPAPDKGYPDPTLDHTSGTAGGVMGAYVCGNNPRGKVAAPRYATSPAVDVSTAPRLMLTFYRWLNSDEAAYMTSTVEVFDGSAWQTIYRNPPSSIVTDATWTKAEYDVTPYKNPAFRVRFGYATPSSKVYAMSSWNVDDVTLSSASCPLP